MKLEDQQRQSNIGLLALCMVTAAALFAFVIVVTIYMNAQARRDNCVQTYEGVRQVFKPFFRTKSVRSAKDQRNIDKFNHRIDELKGDCK